MPVSPPSYRQANVPTRQQADRARGTAAERGYGSKWQAARLGFLARHPRCVAPGCVEAATDVDHIEPHRGDKALFWDRTNWQPLCKACHGAKTARGA